MVRDTRQHRQEERTNSRRQKRAVIAQKRLEMDLVKQQKIVIEPTSSIDKYSSTSKIKPPVTSREPKVIKVSRPPLPVKKGKGSKKS